MKPKTLRTLAQPEDEPISLEEAKAHLRLTEDETQDDAIVSGLISAARRFVEQRLGVALMPTRYRAKWGPGIRLLELPCPPLLLGEDAPLEVSVGGAALDESAYALESDAMPAEIVLDATPGEEVTVTYWGGYASAGDVSPAIKSAILLVVGHLYANREAGTTEGVNELPLGVDVILASESVYGDRW